MLLLLLMLFMLVFLEKGVKLVVIFSDLVVVVIVLAAHELGVRDVGRDVLGLVGDFLFKGFIILLSWQIVYVGLVEVGVGLGLFLVALVEVSLLLLNFKKLIFL